MALPFSKLWPRSGFARFFATFQLIFLIVAIALFGLVAIVGWRRTDLLGILLFTFISGNLMLLSMRKLVPVYHHRDFPWNWLAYAPTLFVVSIAASTAAALLIMPVFHIPWSELRSYLWSTCRMSVLVIMIVGLIHHYFSDTRARLEQKNVELQQTVDAGITISKLQEQDLEKAREIQEGLLPKKIPQIEGLDVAGVWKPARTVGGDYFDDLKFGERNIGLCIGDVVGKGITAALLMANLQATLRAFASASISPATLCRKLNEVLCNNSAADKFVTFCYCTIDARERRLSYANAGHWPPILLRKSGVRVALNVGGFPLGIYPHAAYEDSEVPLESGDRLILYTDGVTEATNHTGEEFGEPRLVELCRLEAGLGAADRLQAITTEVSAFSSGNFQDDFTLVVVAVK